MFAWNVAAVAWLAELFPNAVQREKVLGYTQAFSSVGGLSVAIVNYWLATNYMHLPEIPSLFGTISDESNQAAWRYTLMSGLIPAIPLIIIRPFLPESPEWQKKKDAGELKRARISDLFRPNSKRPPSWQRSCLPSPTARPSDHSSKCGSLFRIPRK